MVNALQTKSFGNDELTPVADKFNDSVESVGEIASHAVGAVSAMASQAACEVGRKADELTASAGIGIQGLGERLSHNAPHSGVLGNASQSVARAVRHSGEYIEESKLSGITQDVAGVIRRNPISAILIAIGVGWYVGRKLRV